MKWYKFNSINKAVIAIVFVIVIFYFFGSKGPWDLYVYILIGALLAGVILIDMVIQAIKDDNQKPKK